MAAKKFVVLKIHGKTIRVPVGDIREARGMAKWVSPRKLRDETDRF